ncbi:MAG TPA: DUF4956 domain-containing protein [Longimicrobiales bacterium]|nr:DUF4956 domain-containing protein [Longimicrobiales bacterium]
MEATPRRLPKGSERRLTPDEPEEDKRPFRVFAGSRHVPFFRLLLFYAALAAIASGLIYLFPLVRHAWMSSPIVDGGEAFSRAARGELASGWRDRDMLERTASVFLITIGALALALPVAWVYTFTRRLRFDASLVHSVIILPLVVSGIVVIVKDSVALAFSLAGIVAVVRFRNTLKDPKDAVYIFLALGIGLAAGVQALDIALVLSFMFNFVVLILWKFNLASIYAEADGDIMSIGERDLMIARGASARDALRWRMSREQPDMDMDGILVVHAPDREAARQRIELSVAKIADDWRFSESFRNRDDITTFAVMLKLKDKKGDPLALLGDIDERWGQDISAAEYVPFRHDAKEEDDE